jgi:putative two-component system response regulator
LEAPTEKHTILIVDDTPANIDVLRGLLSHEYRIKVALDGERALAIINKESPDLVLLDIMMPGMDGYEVCAQLKSNPSTSKFPVIFVTAKHEVDDETKGLKLGAVDYITKPITPSIVKARVKTQLALYDQERHLETLVELRTAEVEKTRKKIINTLGKAAEYRDEDTGLHVVRMSHYSRLIAEAYGLDNWSVKLIYNAAAMHDVGKIGVPDHILLKPGKLDDEEWVIMRSHSKIGSNILGDTEGSELLETSKIIALTHHEKWNGKGYPCGLAGEDIPIVGRIVAIADVFDALSSERPYKKPWPEEKILNLLKEESGEHFDPKVVEAFFSVWPSIKMIRDQFQN